MAVVKSASLQGRAGAHKGMVVLSVRLPNAAAVVDQNVFIADQAYQLVSVEEVHSSLGSDGSAVTLEVVKCTGTQTPAAGTNVLTSTFNLKGTINTVQSGTLSATLAATRLADGDRLAFDISGTPTAVAGAVVTLLLIPDPDKRYWLSNA